MIGKVVLWSVAAVMILGITVYVWPARSIRHEPGILCPDEPLQEEPQSEAPWLLDDDYMVTPLASYEITALVLSRENYYFDKGADVSPVDFALGWGAMSNQAVIDNLKIWQGPRHFAWKASRFPIPRRQIECSSANVHIIPANMEVRDAIDEVCKGSVVTMKGYLVKVTDAKGYRWVSSLRRDDTGDGACEVMWVEELHVE